MLLLSTSVEDERRAKILSDVEGAISNGGGSIALNGDWGIRALAYQIEHQNDAEYHLLQFTGPPELLESLSHNLGITDGVLRHRIIKVLPGTPPAPRPEAAPPPRAQSAPAAAPPAPAAAPPAPAAATPAPPAAEGATTGAASGEPAETDTGAESA